jgi:hypothetical protein
MWGVGIAAFALACGDGTSSGAPSVTVAPLLDTLFVDDTVPPGAYAATYRDAQGQVQPAGAVTWSSSNTGVITVDAATGRVVAEGPGTAVLQALANGVPGRALVVVTRPLDLALLLDTIFLMPGDTFTVPVMVRDQSGSAPPVRFAPSPNAQVYTIDTMTGLVTAQGQGLATRLVARADTVADTGAVEVVVLTDTVGGKTYFTIHGSLTRRARAAARALNYLRTGDTLTFRLNSSISSQNVVVENVIVTLRSALTGAGSFVVDSASPGEVFGPGDFVCRPTKSWGLWSTRTATTELSAVARSGTIGVTRVTAIPNGFAISGSFYLEARRVDYYDDPLGVLPVRGTFVAPLITDATTCGN